MQVNFRCFKAFLQTNDCKYLQIYKFDCVSVSLSLLIYAAIYFSFVDEVPRILIEPKDLLYAGVTTIAGGKWGRGGGHVDGPSEDAKFSNDFDVVYLGSSCSLLVIDRGNQAIREIQLHYEDCADQHNGSFHLGKLRSTNFVITITSSW